MMAQDKYLHVCLHLCKCVFLHLCVCVCVCVYLHMLADGDPGAAKEKGPSDAAGLGAVARRHFRHAGIVVRTR